MKININKINDRYFFEIDDFSSLKHFYLSSDVKSTYAHPYLAYSAALNQMQKHSISLEAFHKISENLLGRDLDITYTEDNAEDIMLSKYREFFNIIKERTDEQKNSMGEKDEEVAYRDAKKLTYEEIKGVVKELLTIKKMIEDDEMESNDSYLKNIDGLIGEFKILVNRNYKKFLQEDLAEKGQEGEMGDLDLDGLDGMGEEEMPLLSLRSPSFNKFASLNNEELDEEDLQELKIEYGEAACSAIVNKHPNCNFKLKNNNEILVYDLKTGDEYIKIQVSDFGTVEKIIPGKDNLFSLQSSSFYQKYWKPIVNEIGHIYIDDFNSLIVPSKNRLPDYPNIKEKEEKEVNDDLEVWDVKNKDFKVISISFSKSPEDSWIFKSNSVGINKEASVEFKSGDAFRAIDPTLESILNKVGYLQEEYDFPNGKELAIDFGRNVVRLKLDQVERVNG